jgi:lipopolysaccharide export system permease protein
MTALMAAGLSRMRIIRPIILAAAALSLVAIANREWVIPRLAYELAQKPSELRGDQGQKLLPHKDFRTDIKIQGIATYSNELRIEQPSFRLPTDLAAYGYQLTAENAYYRPPDGDRPGGYLLDAVQEPKDLDTKPSLPIVGKPLVITSRDAKWLKPKQCFVVSAVTFDDLTTGPAMRQFASTSQLIAELGNPSLGAGTDVRVTIHSRIVRPLLDITLLFLGLPLVVARQSRNIFFAIGVCLAVVAVFILVEMGCQLLGVSSWGVSPALAAWLPLIIFGPIAVGMGDTMRE